MNALRAVILAIAVHTFSLLVTNAESPNVAGGWNIEITFADGQHRFLHFDAQGDGKGTLTVTDPQSKVWSGSKPSEAKWTHDEADSVTFSGPAEFMIGNVGRDPGVLEFKGKFETPDSIIGEVEFSPSIGDRPSKHGSFKALRVAK